MSLFQNPIVIENTGKILKVGFRDLSGAYSQHSKDAILPALPPQYVWLYTSGPWGGFVQIISSSQYGKVKETDYATGMSDQPAPGRILLPNNQVVVGTLPIIPKDHFWILLYGQGMTNSIIVEKKNLPRAIQSFGLFRTLAELRRGETKPDFIHDFAVPDFRFQVM